MRYYVFVKSSFKHTRKECESKRAYVFRCLIFHLYFESYLLIEEFKTWTIGVCSSYVVSLFDFAYYVFR